MKHLLFHLIITLVAGTLLAQNAWINEIHYDNASTDANEFIEVVIENASSYSLSDFTVTLYNGNGGASYSTKTLAEFTQGSSEGNFTFFYFFYPTNGIQNGDPADGLSLNYKNSVISGQFLSYEGVMVANDGPASGLTSTDIGVEESGSTTAEQSLQLGGTGNVYDTFYWQEAMTATPGALNNKQLLTSEIFPEPSNHVSNFAVDSVTSSTIRLQWTGATGDQKPSKYLILGKTASGQFNSVEDGIPIAEDADWSDGNAAFNIGHIDGENRYTADRLTENTTYDFIIYPYTNSGSKIDYKTDGMVPVTSGTTTTQPLLALAEIRQNMNNYIGNTAKVRGTITFVRSGNGFYLQDAAAGWSGIYVYDPATVENFDLADSVLLTGVVDEYNGLAELQSLTKWEILEKNQDLPEPVLVSTGDFPQEKYESVLVQVRNAECITALNQFNEWEVDDGSGSCIVDDYLFAFVPTIGEFYNITGIGNYYLAYKIEPRFAADIELITNAPKIENLNVSTRVPLESEDFIDTVKVIPKADLQVIQLKYMIAKNEENIKSINMIQAGSDSIYTATIPSSEYDDGDPLEYWVYAEDINGEASEGEHQGFFAGYTTIGDLHQIAEDGALIYYGYYARTRGIATVDNTVFDKTHLNVYMQDENFGGINVFKYDAAARSFIRGHEYLVTGKIEQYNGLTQIVPDEATADIVDNGEKGLPSAIVLDLATLLSGPETLEGLLVAIGYAEPVAGTESWPEAGNNANLTITDGTSQLILRIDKDTDIPGSEEPAWPQNIIGILSQYDFESPYEDGYQLLPRNRTDFESPGALENREVHLIPDRMIMYPAYPNPFNPQTQIRFSVPVSLILKNVLHLSIYNSLGQMVKSFSLSGLKPGLNSILWDGRSDAGILVNSGLYFASLQGGGHRETVKLILLR